MGSNNDTAETAGILNDGNTVNLFQTLVNHACTTNIGETCVRVVIYRDVLLVFFWRFGSGVKSR